MGRIIIMMLRGGWIWGMGVVPMGGWMGRVGVVVGVVMGGELL
jgi:hypothetical protein